MTYRKRMKNISFVVWILSVILLVGGCSSRQPSRVREYTCQIWCCVNDEQHEFIPGASVYYGFNMPTKERLSYGGATKCQVAVADEGGWIITNMVWVKDSGPILKRWGDPSAFIAAPGYAPVVWDGQKEVVLISVDEFEGIYTDETGTRFPYARLRGADPCSRIPLEMFQIDLGCDVVTQGPGKGTKGEVKRRLSYLAKYLDEGSPFFECDNDKILVYAVCDHGYWLAKYLGYLDDHEYGTCRGPKWSKVKARDYLEIRMKPEDLPEVEFHKVK